MEVRLRKLCWVLTSLQHVADICITESTLAPARLCTTPDSQTDCTEDRGETSLGSFARGRTVRVKSGAPASFDRRDVIDRARSRIGENCYRLLTNNLSTSVSGVCMVNIAATRWKRYWRAPAMRCAQCSGCR